MKRVFLIVLDSFGIGQMPDAAAYGDINVNTLRSVSRSPYFHMENMKNMGLFNIDGVEVGEKTDLLHFGKPFLLPFQSQLRIRIHIAGNLRIHAPAHDLFQVSLCHFS